MTNNGQWRQTVGAELLGAQHYAHCSRKSADDVCFRDIRDLPDVVLHLSGDSAKLKAVVMAAPQSQGQDWNIVDGAGLDERLRDSRWYAVEIRVELAVDLDQR